MIMTKIDENIQVLNLVQAMLGSISENFIAVFLKCFDTGVKIYFFLKIDSSKDRDEIDDIIFEFEALQSSMVDVDFEIIINSIPQSEIDIDKYGRMVLSMRE
jgi:hypothetical protein